jgi:hypothetical protein
MSADSVGVAAALRHVFAELRLAHDRDHVAVDPRDEFLRRAKSPCQVATRKYR